MSLSCASCRTALAAEARFCPSCGTPAPVSTTSAPADPVREVLKVALGRQYEVQHLLGKGGMGAVYLATEAALEREVAIKVLPPERGATQESRDRFRREARTAAKLSHPNIVPLYTFGDVDGTLYFVMGYVKGESLATRLKREGRLQVEDARRILVEIAEALNYAHKLGVIHRDIKPDNVLIEEETGRALLTDFGVAKALGAGQTMTEVGSVLGTPHYMSPEQAQGKSDIDHRSDLYSLGVMGYAMFAGRLPFEGSTPSDVMVQHITKEAPTLKSFAPDIPPEIANALTRCLAKDPANRWRDALALRGGLARPGDGDVPPELEGLGGFITFQAITAFLLACYAAWRLGGGDTSSPLFTILQFMLVGTFCIPFLLAPVRLLHLKKRGFHPEQIRHEVLRPVHRFPGWLPRRFRHPDDVWDRLPPEIRRARQSVGIMSLAAATGAPLLVYSIASMSSFARTGTYSAGHPRYLLLVWIVVMGLLLSTALVFMVRLYAFRKRHGVDTSIGDQLVTATSFKTTFWSRPEVAAILLPAGRGSGLTSEPDSPAGLLAAVSDVARALRESSRPLGSQAEVAARDLASAIASLDRQIAGLRRAVDPAEPGRLADRLKALGPDRGPTDENREVRAILQAQLDTVRGLEARAEEAAARRARLLDLLKGLWRQARELQSASAASANDEGAAGRLRNLLERIDEAQATPRTLDARGGETHALSDAPTIERG